MINGGSIKENATRLRLLTCMPILELVHSRFPGVQSPRRVCSAVLKPLTPFIHGVKDAELVGQLYSSDPVRLPNLIQAAQVVKDAEEYTGLDSCDARFRRVKLPEALCFCEEAIDESFGVPILGAVGEARVANL